MIRMYPSRVLRSAAILAAGLLAGCQAAQPNQGQSASPPPPQIFGPNGKGTQVKKPQPIDVSKVKTQDDIIQVHQIWQQVPWMGNADGNVCGFKVLIHFISGSTQKGAFVPGVIHCNLYRIDRTPGHSQRFALNTWELNEHQAMDYRATRNPVTGYFYGFILNWPSDLQIAGKEIEIEFTYTRGDGRVITGTPKRMKVPLDSEAAQKDLKNPEP